MPAVAPHDPATSPPRQPDGARDLTRIKAELVGLVAAERRDRLRAIREASGARDAETLAFALRRVLFTDGDALVRAAAARRLGEVQLADIEAWLIDALLADAAPMVREAILRALANRSTADRGDAIRERTLDVVRAFVASEKMWWVRRTAVYALAALGGMAELAALKAVLGDPFWRVRRAAIGVLAALGARDLEVRQELLAEPADGAARAALQYLRASWGPVAVEPREVTVPASRLPAELLDPDPAVVTARLIAMPVTAIVEPLALVELLADPHVTLRLAAVEKLQLARDPRAFAAVLEWLDEPRIPHVIDTVEHLLDGIGEAARPLAEAAFAGTRLGALRWAIQWTVATQLEELYGEAVAAAEREPGLRIHAVPIAETEDLLAWIASPGQAGLVDAIAAELHGRHAYEELTELELTTHPAARTLQIEAAARLDAWPIVEAALADPHHGPRAIATHWLVRTHRADGAAQVTDPDPAVREAALANPAHAVALIGDPDPWVARRAADQLVELSYRCDRIAAAAEQAFASGDPWLRARACLVAIDSDRQLEHTIAALADEAEMVRSAALEALERTPNLAQRLAAIEPHARPTAKRMIAAWLRNEVAPDVPLPEPRPRAAPPPAAVAQRPFGRLPFTVAPLAISGAFDPTAEALELAAAAGVNLWFWEPAYDNLTKHLREHPGGHVITGSYHADAPSIEADVDRALKRLRRTHLDVLLLFWARSPARVDAAAYEAIAHLKRSGKVRALGFSTHHRQLARDAIERSPWDVVMIRHSAAHPGIETELLPVARARRTAILTFSALSYGRMLQGPSAPTAAQAYQYSMQQPGVTATISAPRRRSELRANIAALTAPELTDEQLQALRDHGRGVRAENQRFNSLLRQPTRDAAAAARELLAAELPPSDEVAQRPLPRPSDARSARTNLGARTSRSRRR